MFEHRVISLTIEGEAVEDLEEAREVLQGLGIRFREPLIKVIDADRFDLWETALDSTIEVGFAFTKVIVVSDGEGDIYDILASILVER